MKRGVKLVVMLVALCMGICFGRQAKATVVVPASGDTTGVTDSRSQRNAFAKDNHIVFESGKTYYLAWTIWAENNQKITATGAKIVVYTSPIRNHATKTNFNSLSNFEVDGGTWMYDSTTGYTKTMMMIAHANNVRIKNATIYCNYEGHGIELIACKNVWIDNCKLYPLGKVNPNSHEEQIQIDIATKKTAPTVANEGKQFVQGQICEKITVSRCKVIGSRGIGVNYSTTEDKKYVKQFHKNIVLKNNVITGKSAEAVSLFNVVGVTVTGNTMVSECKKLNNAYSVGCHLAMFGKAPIAMNKATFTFTNNIIKGGRQALFTYAHCSSKFGKIVATDNKCYAKSGKSSALVLHKKSYKKKAESKNKVYRW